MRTSIGVLYALLIGNGWICAKGMDQDEFSRFRRAELARYCLGREDGLEEACLRAIGEDGFPNRWTMDA